MFGGSGSTSSSFTSSPTPPWAHDQPSTHHLPPPHSGRWSPETTPQLPGPGPASGGDEQAAGNNASSDLRSVLSGPNLSLWSLQSAGDDIKPSYPYPTLIACAIMGSERKMLTLEELYDAIEERFPYFKSYKPYRNSIRHNLSLNAMFVKTPRPITAPGKGNYWAVREGASLTAPGGTKRPRKRGPRGKNKEPSPPTEVPLQAAKYTISPPVQPPPLDIYLHREAAIAPYSVGFPPHQVLLPTVLPRKRYADAEPTSPTRSTRRPEAPSAAGPVRTMRRARSPAVTPYVIPVTSDEYPPSPPPAWVELDPIPALHYGSSLSPDDGDWLPSPHDGGGVLLPSAPRRTTAGGQAAPSSSQRPADPPSSSGSSSNSESEDVLASRPSAVPLPAFGAASLTLPSINRPVLPAAPSFGTTGFSNVSAITLPPLPKRTRF